MEERIAGRTALGEPTLELPDGELARREVQPGDRRAKLADVTERGRAALRGF